MAARQNSIERCGVCRRTFLTGERARRFRDERGRADQLVCPLCVERAERLGWHAVDGEGTPAPTESPTPRAQADLVARLRRDVEHLTGEAAAGRGALEKARAEVGREAQRAVELEALVQTLREGIAGRDARIAELESAQESLLRARRRESDVRYLAGIAAEVFNRSAHLYDVQALAARHGEPQVAVAPEGISLPRPLILVFAWADGWRRFRISCDLVARLFDVVDLGAGVFEQPGRPFSPNARLVDGRVELIEERVGARR